MHITEAGLPDYCLTLVSRGSLACLGTSTPGSFEANEAFGLIYRGLPGMALSASQDHERLAIWIPAASLQQRLVGLVGGPVSQDIVFDPSIWPAYRGSASSASFGSSQRSSAPLIHLPETKLPANRSQTCCSIRCCRSCRTTTQGG